MGSEWTNLGKILAVRQDSIGDVVMTGPALRALKESLPGSTLSLLCSRAGQKAASLLPEVDETLVYDPPWMKHTPMRHDSGPDHGMIDQVRSRGFDAAFIFTVFSQNALPAALFCYLSDIPLRIAYCRENPYQLLTHWVPETEPDKQIRHEVRRHLDLAAYAGCHTTDERLRIHIPAATQDFVDEMLKSRGLDGRAFAVLHPGATAPSRRYPPESFAAVARTLIREHGLHLIWTGSAADRPLIESIRKELAMKSDAFTELSLPELSAVIRRAGVLISNNTAPAHLAAAVGTPVVDLYALTNPQHTPWMVRKRVLFHDVPCRFCYKSICPEGHHDCLRKVHPRQVVEATLEILNKGTLPEKRKETLHVHPGN